MPDALRPEADGPDALEQALRRLAQAEALDGSSRPLAVDPAPGGAFRADLRGRFLAGFPSVEGSGGSVPRAFEKESGSASRAPAEDRTPPRTRSVHVARLASATGAPPPPLESVEQRLRAQPPIPTARETYRERLREDFASGRLAAAPASAGGSRRFRFLLGGTGLLAAAALLLVLANPGLLGGLGGASESGLGAGGSGVAQSGVVLDGGWRVTTPAGGSGLVRVGGESLTLGDQARIAAAWNGGESIEAEGAPFELQHPDGLRLSVLPGARTRLASEAVLASETGQVAWSVGVERGEVMLETIDDYRGLPVTFSTRDSSVLVTGTALSVMCDERGTCVCVEHGTVVVRCLRSGKPMEVGEEETCFVFHEAEAPFEGTFCEARKRFGDGMLHGHIEPLRAFCK